MTTTRLSCNSTRWSAVKKVIRRLVKQAAKGQVCLSTNQKELSGSPEMEAIMNLGADGIMTAAFGFISPK